MDIIEKVRQFVEDECKKPTNKQGFEPFTYHFALVVEYVKELAKEHDADSEILEIAGWMHDIGSIMIGRADHHITSSKIAEEKLREFGYPEDRIKWVTDTIYTHRGSQKMKPKTIEGQILIEADAMSAFMNISGLFRCALVYEELSRHEAAESVKRKLQNKWEQLGFPKSKEMMKPYYDAAMLLLNSKYA